MHHRRHDPGTARWLWVFALGCLLMGAIAQHGCGKRGQPLDLVGQVLAAEAALTSVEDAWATACDPRRPGGAMLEADTCREIDGHLRKADSAVRLARRFAEAGREHSTQHWLQQAQQALALARALLPAIVEELSVWQPPPPPLSHPWRPTAPWLAPGLVT